VALAKDALKDIVACMWRARATRRRCALQRSAPAGVRRRRLWSTARPRTALDYDDNYHPMAGHATAVLAPAIFALAEIDARIRRCGAGRLHRRPGSARAGGNGVNLVHYERGWHSTSTLGPFGAAAACARLLGLDKRGVTAALSLAFSMASGSKLQFGTMAKPLACRPRCPARRHGGNARASGVAGVAEPLEAPWGFRDLFAGAGSPGYRPRGIGRPLAIERYGLKAKIHPCCASVHTAVDALLFLKQKYRFDAGDVESIDVLVNRVSYDNLRYPDPKTDTEARFSMQWAIALALLQDRLRLADFTPAALKRRELRAWLPRIRMRHTRPARAPFHGERPRARAHDGAAEEREEAFALCAAAQRHAADSAQRKRAGAEIRGLRAGQAGPRRMLDRLESVRDIRTLTALIRPSPPRHRSPSASRAAPGRRR
jgi:2-methylcitrate dehydratase PrpD